MQDWLLPEEEIKEEIKEALKVSQPTAPSLVFLNQVNLSSPDYQPSKHSPPKGESTTPSLSSPTEGNLWLVAASTPGLLASLGGMVKRAGKTSTH